MVTIRKAEPRDRVTLLHIARVQAQAYYCKLRIDLDKVSTALRDAIIDGSQFVWLAEDQGLPVGALVAVSGPHLWAQRRVSQIALFESSRAPAGLLLLRQYKKWVRSGRGIRTAGVVIDSSPGGSTLDDIVEVGEKVDRFRRLLVATGFEQQSGQSSAFYFHN